MEYNQIEPAENTMKRLNPRVGQFGETSMIDLLTMVFLLTLYGIARAPDGLTRAKGYLHHRV